MIKSLDIDKMFHNKTLNEEEIITLMKMNCEEIFSLMKAKESFHQQVLINIYWNPALLYKCKGLSEELIEALINFVGYRFNAEKEEIKTRLSDGYISSSEYKKYVIELEKHFFPEDDSVTTKNIKRIVENRNKEFQKGLSL